MSDFAMTAIEVCLVLNERVCRADVPSVTYKGGQVSIHHAADMHIFFDNPNDENITIGRLVDPGDDKFIWKLAFNEFDDPQPTFAVLTEGDMERAAKDLVLLKMFLL